MDECIDSYGNASTFSRLDANWGFWKVEVAGEDRDKAVLVAHHGLCNLMLMPLDLKPHPRPVLVMDVIFNS